MAGVLYPVYRSFKALESTSRPPNDENDQWLAYWVIFGSLQLVEGYVDDVLSW